MTTDEYLNLARWCKAIYDQQQQFQAQILKELARMSAELDALKQTVAQVGTSVEAALAALATAKANEADPAVLTQMNSDLTAAVTKINAAVPPVSG